LTLNAALYAQSMNIRTGQQVYDYQLLQAQANTALPAQGATYQYALDASALGAMYANQISLIGTEAGLGVRSQGLISSTDHLQLTADGRLELKDTVAAGSLQLHSVSADVLTHGTSYGQQLQINAAGNLHNTGLMAAAKAISIDVAGLQQQGDLIAGINQQGEWQQNAQQQIKVQQSLLNQGRLLSSGTQQVQAQQLQNDTDAVLQAIDSTVSAEDIQNLGTVNSHSLVIKAANLQNAGHLQAQQLQLDTKQLTQTAGVLSQTNASGQLNITATGLQLTGGILAAEGQARLAVSDHIRNEADWLMKGATQLTTGALHNSGQMMFGAAQSAVLSIEDSLNNQHGWLQFDADALVSAAQINNQHGQIQHTAAGILSLTSQQQLNNKAGKLLSNGSINIVANALDNQQGVLSAEQLQLSVKDRLHNQTGQIQGTEVVIHTDHLVNQHGSITALGSTTESLKLNAASLLNNSQGNILAKGSQLSLQSQQILNEQGKILHGGTDGFTLNSALQLHNNSGLLQTAGRLDLQTPQLNNQQGMIGAQQLLLSGAELDNRAGQLSATADTGTGLKLNFSGDIDNSELGLIQSAGQVAVIQSANLRNERGRIVLSGEGAQLQLSTAQLQNRQGQLHSHGDLLLQASVVDNQSGTLVAAADLQLLALDVNNIAGQLLSGRDLRLQAKALFNTQGAVVAAEQLQLQTGSLHNGQGGIISAAQAQIAADVLTNAAQASIEGQHVRVSTPLLDNAGTIVATGQQLETLQLHTDVLRNRGRIESHGQNLHLRLRLLENQQGKIYQSGQGVLRLEYQQALNNAAGELNTNGQLVLAGGQLNNSAGTIQAQQALQLAVTNLNNQQGLIQTAADLTLNASQIDNRQGKLLAATRLQLDTEQLDNSTGQIFNANGEAKLNAVVLRNDAGRIDAGTGAFQIKAATVHNNNKGVIAAGDLKLSAATLDNRQGQISAGQTKIITTDFDNTAGQLRSKHLTLQAGNLRNELGTIFSTESLSLQLTDTLDNRQGSLITRATQAQIRAGQIDNNAGLISQQAVHSLELHTGLLNNQAGTLHSAQQLDLNAGEFNNSGVVNAKTLNLLTSTLTNQGTIQAEQARVQSQQLSNHGLLLVTGTADDALQLAVGNGIVNRGHLQSHGRSFVLRDTLINDGGTVVHAGSGQMQLAAVSNQQGKISAQHGLTIAGKLLNRDGLLYAAGALQVQGSELDNHGGVIDTDGSIWVDVVSLDNQGGQLSSAGDSTQLKVAGSLQNAGGVIASRGKQLLMQVASLQQGDGVISGQGSVTISSHRLEQQQRGQIRAQQTLALQATELQNAGVLSGSQLQLRAASLHNQAGRVEATERLQLTAGFINNSTGLLASGGELSIDIQDQQAGIALNNQQGRISAGGTVRLTTPYAVDNVHGQLLSEQQLQLQAQGLDNSAGEILAGQHLSLALAEALRNNQGVLFSRDGDLTLAAQRLDNDAKGLLLQQGRGQAQFKVDTLNNAGVIAGRDLSLSTQHFNNSGTVQAEQLSIIAKQLDNKAGTLATVTTDGGMQIRAESLNNQAGLIQSRGQQLLLDTRLHNQQGEVVLLGAGVLSVAALSNNQQGTLLSAGAVRLAGEVNNAQGLVQAGTDLTGATSTINNQAGVIHAGGQLALSGNNLHNQAGKITAAGPFLIAVNGVLNNSQQGVLSAAGPMAITAVELNNQTGLVQQQGDHQLQLEAERSLDNNGGTIAAAADVKLKTQTLQNNKGLLQGKALDLQLAQLHNEHGQLKSSGLLKLQSSTLQNYLGKLQGRDFDLQLTGGLHNQQGSLIATDKFTMVAAAVDNAQGTLASHGSLQLTVAEELKNRQGLVQASTHLQAGARQLDNTGGTVQAQTAQLTSQQHLNNEGGTIQAQSLALTTAALDNRKGFVLASGNQAQALQLQGLSQLQNDAGTVASYGHDWQLAVAQLLNHKGQLLHLGTGRFTLAQAGELVNRGTIATQADLVIEAAALNNSGTVQARQQLQLNAGLHNQADAALLANAVAVNAAEKTIHNAGTISATAQLQLQAASIKNSALLHSANSAQIRADNIENQGSVSATELAISGFSVLKNNGRIESHTALYSGQQLSNQKDGLLLNSNQTGNSLQLNIAQLDNSGILHNSAEQMTLGGQIHNSGQIIHAGIGVLSLASLGHLQNTGGSIASAGHVHIQHGLVGTGSVFAAQGMQLSSHGTFVNQNHLYSKGQLLVHSALDNQGGSLLSDGNLTINTEGQVTNSGRLQGQNLSLSSAELNNNAGIITSTGSENAQIRVNRLSNDHGVIQASNQQLTVSALSGDLDNRQGQIRHSGNGSLIIHSAGDVLQQQGQMHSAGHLVLQAQGDVRNNHGVIQAGQFQLSAVGQLDNTEGSLIGSQTGSGLNQLSSATLRNQGGVIAANSADLTMTAGSIDNHNGSVLLAGLGQLRITTDTLLNHGDSGRMISNGAMALQSSNALANSGQISAAQLLSLSANTIHNQGLLASRTGKLHIADSHSLNNHGILSGANAVQLNVQLLNNSTGTLQSDGMLEVAAQQLTIGTMQAQDIALRSKSALQLQTTEQMTASGSINLQTDGNLSNSGTIVANGLLQLSAAELHNQSSGKIRAGQDAVLRLQQLTNQGTVSSHADLSLQAPNITNSGTLAAGRQLNMQGNLANQQLVFAGAMLSIEGDVHNTANIYSNLDARLHGRTITNKGGSIAAAQDLSISGTITNDLTGTLSYSAGQVTSFTRYPGGEPSAGGFAGGNWVSVEKGTTELFTAELDGQMGLIAAGRDLQLHGDITNNFSTIAAGRDLSLTGLSLHHHSAVNKEVSRIETEEQQWSWGCAQYSKTGDAISCNPDDEMASSVQVKSLGTREETVYKGQAYGTIVAGRHITGNLSQQAKIGLVDAVNALPTDTSAAGSRGGVARGEGTTAQRGTSVAMSGGVGQVKATSAAQRTVHGPQASNTASVDANWRSQVDTAPTRNVPTVALAPGASADPRQVAAADGSAIAINHQIQSPALPPQLQSDHEVAWQSRQTVQTGQETGLDDGSAPPGVPTLTPVSVEQRQDTAGAMLQAQAGHAQFAAHQGPGAALAGRQRDLPVGSASQAVVAGPGWASPNVAGRLKQPQGPQLQTPAVLQHESQSAQAGGQGSYTPDAWSEAWPSGSML